MSKAKVIQFLDEARTVLREQPGLDSNDLLDRLEEKGFPTPFSSTTERKQNAAKKANEDAANLLQDLKEKSDFTAKQTLETGPESTASAIVPPKMSAAQINTMIVDMGGKPDKKGGEYKFGIGGFVKMSTSFEDGKLSGVKGNNYSAMAKTLAESGAKSISVEGTPLRAFKLLRESVNAGLTASNVSITKSFPIGDRAWSYDSKLSVDDNKKAFDKAFNFIPKDDLKAVFDKLVENRKTPKDEAKVVTTPEATSEQETRGKKGFELTSNGVIDEKNMEKLFKLADESNIEITRDPQTGVLTTNGSDNTKGEQALIHAKAGATEIKQEGNVVNVNSLNTGRETKDAVIKQMNENQENKADQAKDSTKENNPGMQPKQ